MHIVVATPYLPWPLTDGGRVAQFRTFEAMQNVCRFTVVAPVYSLEEEADAKCLARNFPNLSVDAVRCFEVPTPSSPRAKARRMAVSFLRKLFPAPKANYSAGSEHVEGDAAPFYPFYTLNPSFVDAAERHLAKGCDIFQAEFSDMLTLGPLINQKVPTVFVNHQLHFVYARRFMKENKITNTNARYLTERMILEEAAYLELFDSVIVFSKVDHEALAEFNPQLDIHVSPFPSPQEPMSTPLRFTEATKHFVFVASEVHRPNADGLRWFMREVWPIIRQQLPDAIIEVVGKWSEAAQKSLPHHTDIRFTGFVEKLEQALRGKIMVVPVWIGSGIRTKILAAWSASCPVVTTTVGMEGLPGQAGMHFMVADDAAAFAQACLELSQDIGKLNHIATMGLELVKERFSLEAVCETRLTVYNNLIAKNQLKKA